MTTNETRYGPTAHEHLVCTFCEREIDLDETACWSCREYKGIMTVEGFEAYLNLEFDCACVSDGSDTIALCGCGAPATHSYPGMLCESCFREWAE